MSNKDHRLSLKSSSEMDPFSREPSKELIQMIKDKKIKVSVVGSAIRPFLWMDLYNDFLHNSVDFEIIFCGNAKYNFEFPKNFRYIYTEVKPAQCNEIAAREATGDFIYTVSDDIIYNKYCLDNFLDTFIKSKDDLSIICGRFFWNNEVIYDGRKHKMYGYKPISQSIIDFNNIDEKKLPDMPCSFFMKTNLYHKLGGIDKNFVGVMWDWDISMRVISAGGKLYYSNYSLLGERIYLKKNNISLTQHPTWNKKEDKIIFNSFWTITKNGRDIDSNLFYPIPIKMSPDHGNQYNFISKYRLKSFEPFLNDNILVSSQGNKGIWK